jgi:hypothetical protein
LEVIWGSISTTFLVPSKSTFCAFKLLMLLTASMFGENVPKYGARCKSYKAENAAIF